MSDLERVMAFHLNAIGLNDYEIEWRFHPERRWRFDFCWPNEMIALEVEGGTWSNGGHSRGKGFESDCEKYNEATILGWRVLRVTTDMVRDGRALAFVERALA